MNGNKITNRYSLFEKKTDVSNIDMNDNDSDNINMNMNDNDNDNDNDGDTWTRRIGFRKRGLARQILQTLRRIPSRRALPLLLVATFLLVCPARAKAAAAVDAASAVVAQPASAAAAAVTTTTTTTSIVCPVSAEVEFRLGLRLVYSALLGAALGKERSFAKHSAGVRTMSLVSMGATIFTVCSCYGFTNFPKVDASRMAANVASGVGFVGAGVITTSMRYPEKGDDPKNFQQLNVVHGLTTAATIWLSAAVGVSCGVGLLRVATIAAAATIFILRMGRKPKPVDSPTKKDDGDYPQQQQQQQQQNHRRLWSLFRSNDNNRKENNRVILRNYSSDDYDGAAEIHEIPHWDQHRDQEQHEEDRDKNISIFESGAPNPNRLEASSYEQDREVGANQGAPKEEQYRPTHYIDLVDATIKSSANNGDNDDAVDDSDDDLPNDPSELMEEIVRSAWKNDKETVTALVDLVLDRYEHRERVLSKQDRKDNSREDSGYLP